MNYEQMSNNNLHLRGIIDSEPKFSHEVMGEGFYEINLKVKRLSEQYDILPVTVSERLLADAGAEVGKEIGVTGQFRSYNKTDDEKSRLMLTVFVREIEEADERINPNTITLTGYLCKQPIYRTTPFNREIADMLLAVNRAYNKSDYIPCIAWGRNARFVKNMNVGEKITVSGRIQSREYQKNIDGVLVSKTAYEVSVNKIFIGGNEAAYDGNDDGHFYGGRDGRDYDYKDGRAYDYKEGRDYAARNYSGKDDGHSYARDGRDYAAKSGVYAKDGVYDIKDGRGDAESDIYSVKGGAESEVYSVKGDAESEVYSTKGDAYVKDDECGYDVKSDAKDDGRDDEVKGDVYVKDEGQDYGAKDGAYGSNDGRGDAERDVCSVKGGDANNSYEVKDEGHAVECAEDSEEYKADYNQKEKSKSESPDADEIADVIADAL